MKGEKNNMRTLTIEDEKRLMPFVEEGIRDIEENGTMPIEELWKRLDEAERREKLYKKQRITKLLSMKSLGKTVKRFVRA